MQRLDEGEKSRRREDGREKEPNPVGLRVGESGEGVVKIAAVRRGRRGSDAALNEEGDERTAKGENGSRNGASAGLDEGEEHRRRVDGVRNGDHLGKPPKMQLDVAIDGGDGESTNEDENSGDFFVEHGVAENEAEDGDEERMQAGSGELARSVAELGHCLSRDGDEGVHDASDGNLHHDRISEKAEDALAGIARPEVRRAEERDEHHLSQRRPHRGGVGRHLVVVPEVLARELRGLREQTNEET